LSCERRICVLFFLFYSTMFLLNLYSVTFKITRPPSCFVHLKTVSFQFRLLYVTWRYITYVYTSQIQRWSQGSWIWNKSQTYIWRHIQDLRGLLKNVSGLTTVHEVDKAHGVLTLIVFNTVPFRSYTLRSTLLPLLETFCELLFRDV